MYCSFSISRGCEILVGGRSWDGKAEKNKME